MSTIGRNDPCICGSGKKYKNCCFTEGRTAGGEASKKAMIVVGFLLLLALVVVVASMVGGGGACPPGQVFDAAHGHCH